MLENLSSYISQILPLYGVLWCIRVSHAMKFRWPIGMDFRFPMERCDWPTPQAGKTKPLSLTDDERDGSGILRCTVTPSMPQATVTNDKFKYF